MNEQSTLNGDAVLLRIFIGSRDMHDGRNLCEVIVQKARDAGLAGATVFEGFMGYGANSTVHHAGLWRLSQDLPVVVEIVDEESKVRAFLPSLEDLLSGGGLVTLERVTVLRDRPENQTDPEAKA
jgi:PII-like signaling protein